MGKQLLSDPQNTAEFLSRFNYWIFLLTHSPDPCRESGSARINPTVTTINSAGILLFNNTDKSIRS